MTAALNYEQIKSYSERISKPQPFIDQYNWKEIDFLSHKKYWKKFESNNKSIALNVLHVAYNTEEIRHAFKLKYNKKHENQVILLTITDGKTWHYLKLSALFREIISKQEEDFYCLNCLPSCKIENFQQNYGHVIIVIF